MDNKLQIGAKAPDFALPAHNNTTIQLQDYKGHKVVLYFYPKDNTPGCTLEAHDFAKHHDQFAKLNTVVLGVSRDSLASHHKFATSCNLPFPLLSDSDGKLCEAYGVWQQKSMFGRKYMGIQRSTFLIDEKGVIKHIWPDVSVLGHAKAVLAAIEGGK